MEVPSDRLFCCPWIRHRVPQPYREELYHILRMTVPVLITRILAYMLPFVNTMFCGRLGNNVMAGYGLACATINITTTSTGYGLAVACDTLVSQTFGGKNLRRVGVVLQRSVLILLLFCLPVWGLLINAQAILLSIGQDPEVSRIAQMYITAFLPAVPVLYIQQLQISYLQNQVIILPQLYTAVAANIANVLTNYLLQYWLKLGVSGSVAANALCHFYSCGFLFAYIKWKKLHAETWGGWSVEALQEWGSYMKLAVASAFMKCAEWWVYEFGGFFAGMMSENELAAQHGVIMIAFIIYMFPMGIQAAACARVGNALGAGKTSEARLTVKVSFGLAMAFAVLEGIVLGSTKHVIGRIFTSDEKINQLISHLMNAYIFLQFFDGLVCTSTGIFVGTGKQKIPAVANIISYYGIGLTLGVVLMFVAKLRVIGFWLGLLICVSLQSTFFLIVIIFKLNWKNITEEAVKRAHKVTDMASSNEKTLLENTSNDASAQNPGIGNTDGCKAPCTGSYESMKEEESDRRQVRGGLSSTQLLLRRGLVTLGAVALLAVGVTVRFLVPLPESRFPETNSTLDWSNTTDVSTLLLDLQPSTAY